MALPSQWAKLFATYGSDNRAPFVNVLWYIPQAPIVPLDQLAADSLAEAVRDILVPIYEACMPNEADFFGIQGTVNDSGTTFECSSSPVLTAGTVVSDQLPDYAAAIIRKQTGNGGPTGRGRFFIGCVPETLTDTGRLTEVARTGVYNDLAAGLFASVITPPGDWFACLYSAKNDTLSEITGVAVKRVLVTQRRRRLRQTAF